MQAMFLPNHSASLTSLALYIPSTIYVSIRLLGCTYYKYCNMTGEPDFELTKVSGPRNRSRHKISLQALGTSTLRNVSDRALSSHASFSCICVCVTRESLGRK